MFVSAAFPAFTPPDNEVGQHEQDRHPDKHDRSLEGIGVHDRDEPAEDHVDRGDHGKDQKRCRV